MIHKTRAKSESNVLTAPLTEKGQVTIPKSIRMLLKLEGQNIVGFRVAHGKVEIVSIEVKAASNPFTEEEWKKIERLAHQRGKVFKSAEKAKEYARSL